MKLFLSTSFLFCICSLFGQVNLVPNPSFEEYTGCPVELVQLDSADLWSPAHGTVDYYNSCNNVLGTGYVGVPNNLFGYLNAHTGVAYAGFVAYVNPVSNYREYMQTLLLDSLEEGVEYEISMYLSIPKHKESNPVGPVGVYFTSDTVDVSYSGSNYSLCCAADVSFDTVPSVHGTWLQVSAKYLAEGGERLMIIGNFERNEDCVYIDNPDLSESCYYLVDDVSVIPIEDPENEVINELIIALEMPNVFTPNDDLINDVFRPVKMKNIVSSNLVIMNRWGQKIYETDDVNSGWDGTNNDSNCADGTYFWKVEYVDVNGAQQGNHGVVQLVR